MFVLHNFPFFKNSCLLLIFGTLTQTSLEQNPFEELATRAPDTISERKARIRENAERLAASQNSYGGYGYQRPMTSLLYYVYPGLYLKGADYCPQMRPHFRFHCQPSKPLRLDLVEFCKDYSDYCNVINYHRLPGPGLGPRHLNKDQGHVGVNGNFGFGIGVVPGLEIDAGWGVDVGPLPIGDSVGVDVDFDLGLLGATNPEKYRRGMDNPNDRRSGLVGIGGGVGVDAVGVPVGVNSGFGVGK